VTQHTAHNGNGASALASSARLRLGDPGAWPPADPTASRLPSDAAISQAIDAARELAGIVSQSEVTRIAISIGDVRWEVERRDGPPAAPAAAPLAQPPAAAAAPAVPAPPPVPLPQPAAAEVTALPPAGAGAEVVVTAPLVGVFYAAPGPGQPPFAEPGTQVTAGQQVAIIEAMKLMNEVVAPCAGVVTEVHVANADIVEHGQPLMTIRPS
jgi:acetyl-CoA carboxylase biotin carboxyl carrier protein